MERLVREYLRLPAYVVDRHYAGHRWLRDDLIAAGTLGLVKAARRFRGDEADFPAYAALTIRRHALDALKDLAWPVRLPRNQRGPAPEWTRVALWAADQERGGVVDPVPQERKWWHLPEPQRSTLGRWMSGWKQREIAMQDGVTRQAVSARIRRARAQLAG